MQRRRDIEQLVRDWFDSATRGDPGLVRNRVPSTAEVRLIGSDPHEYLAGGKKVREFLIGEVEGSAGKARFEPRHIEAFSEGTVGWATAKLTITLPDGGQVYPRWSAVLLHEDGEWRFMQIHASIGISNDDVGWIYPDRN